MNKTTQIAFLEMFALKIPVPPPRIKLNFEKLKTIRIMEESMKVVEDFSNKVDEVLEQNVTAAHLRLVKSEAESRFHNGDFIVTRHGVKETNIFIYKGNDPIPENFFEKGIPIHVVLARTNVITIPYSVYFSKKCHPSRGSRFRLAKPEEKQLLLDELGKAGYSWDEERKVVVKNFWKPKMGEIYYIPYCMGSTLSPYKTSSYDWRNEKVEVETWERGWVFQTKEECDAFCQKLNEAIQNVKRE